MIDRFNYDIVIILFNLRTAKINLQIRKEIQ